MSSSRSRLFKRGLRQGRIARALCGEQPAAHGECPYPVLWRVVAALVAVAILAVLYALFGMPVASARGRSAEAELAARYSPIVYLRQQQHPCDTDGEAFYPAPVEIVLDNPNVVLRDENGKVVSEGPTASDLFGKGEGYYLDLPGDPRHAGCQYEEDFKALAPNYPPAVYAHIVNEPGSGQIVLQYWFYFYFNNWNNNHESDWEFIQLVFDATSAEEALTLEPAAAGYAQHESGERAEWGSSKLRKEDGHPVVYTPKGSHASRYSPAIALGKGEGGTGFGCDDASPPLIRVEPEARLIPDEISGPNDPFAWITYEGRWGQKLSGWLNGPTGPNMKKQWDDPMEWQRKLRDSSITVPEGTIGPNAAEVFCAVVAGGSQLLIRAGPFAALGLVIAAFGSIAVTARRTRFRPAQAMPLRQPRRFGQIVGAALRLERENMGLFLGMGVVFVPFGAALTLLQWLIFEHPPVEPILGVVDNVLANGTVALALGGLGFALADWLVVSAVTCALGEIEAGRCVGVVTAYRLLWGNLRTLLGARLRESAVVCLLGLTIVGIPWAIRRIVRCIFLEQAIILDGSSAHDAPRASERVVSGEWWRTLGCTIAIVCGAVALGPIVGVGLLLLTSVSLSVINLTSSIVYVALIPFAAIAMTMLYFDLGLARDL